MKLSPLASVCHICKHSHTALEFLTVVCTCKQVLSEYSGLLSKRKGLTTHKSQRQLTGASTTWISEILGSCDICLEGKISGRPQLLYHFHTQRDHKSCFYVHCYLCRHCFKKWINNSKSWTENNSSEHNQLIWKHKAGDWGYKHGPDRGDWGREVYKVWELGLPSGSSWRHCGLFFIINQICDLFSMHYFKINIAIKAHIHHRLCYTGCLYLQIINSYFYIWFPPKFTVTHNLQKPSHPLNTESLALTTWTDYSHT